MARALLNLAGQTFSRVTVIGRADQPPGKRSRATWWSYRCKCGKAGIATSQALVRGGVKSCGCFRRERMAALARANGARSSANIRAAKAKDKVQREALEAFYAPKQWKDIEQAARALEAAWGGVQR